MPLRPAEAALRAALKDLRARGLTALGAAVSGGGDSLAMLDLLVPLARAEGLRLEAATVDHGLRPEAAAEARMVAGFCAEAGVRHETLLWTDRQGGGNLSALAREARYRLLAGWARQRELGAVFIAHNLEDLAETFLIRLGRAAGLEGLAAMAPEFERHGTLFLRPLLEVPREALRDHLRAKGIPWAEDPGNQDPAYARVRARNLLPQLEAAGISPAAIALSARALSEARSWAGRQLAADWHSFVRTEGPDFVLSGLPEDPEAERRLLVTALQQMGDSPWPPRREALARLRAGIATGVARQTLGGCLVTWKKGILRISREFQAVSQLRASPDDWWDGRWQIRGERPEGCHLAALGEGLQQIPDWRDFSPLPRDSLRAGPALWCGDRLIAAPLARPEPQWQLLLRKGFGTLPFLH